MSSTAVVSTCSFCQANNCGLLWKRPQMHGIQVNVSLPTPICNQNFCQAVINPTYLQIMQVMFDVIVHVLTADCHFHTVCGCSNTCLLTKEKNQKYHFYSFIVFLQKHHFSQRDQSPCRHRIPRTPPSSLPSSPPPWLLRRKNNNVRLGKQKGDNKWVETKTVLKKSAQRIQSLMLRVKGHVTWDH